MLENLLLLWIAALALMGSPGPATLSLAGVGAAFGVRRGLRYLAGIMLGTFCVLLLIATGVTGLIMANPALVTLLTLVGGAYILYLAWKIARAPVGGQDPDAPSPRFATGLALAIANPKAFAAIGAVYSSHRLYEASLAADTFSKVLALTLVIVLVNSAWLAFGSSLSRFLRSPRSGRIANLVFALLLVASVALAVFEGFLRQ